MNEKMMRPRTNGGISTLTPSYNYNSLMAQALNEYGPSSVSPYQQQADYLMNRPVFSRGTADYDPMASFQYNQPAPQPPVSTMPTQPAPQPPVSTMPTQPAPQPPVSTMPTQPVTQPVTPVGDPTTLAELEALLGYKWVKNEDTSPIRNMMYTEQDHLRAEAQRYGIALPPDAAIIAFNENDIFEPETPVEDLQLPENPIQTNPVITGGPTPSMPDPANTMPDPANTMPVGTTINLPFGGSFTMTQEMQDRIDAMNNPQPVTQPVTPVEQTNTMPIYTMPTQPVTTPVSTSPINFSVPFGGSFTLPQDIQDRIDAINNPRLEMTQTVNQPVKTTQPVRASQPVSTIANPAVNFSGPFGGNFTMPDDMQDRIDAAKAAQAVKPPAPVATPTMSEDELAALRARIGNLGLGGFGNINLAGIGNNIPAEEINKRGKAFNLNPATRGGFASHLALSPAASNPQSNVDFVNQMSQENALAGGQYPTFRYDPQTNQYIKDSRSLGFTGDAAITYLTPEEFQAEYGRALSKMPSLTQEGINETKRSLYQIPMREEKKPPQESQEVINKNALMGRIAAMGRGDLRQGRSGR